MFKSIKLRKKKKKIAYSFYHASSLTYDWPLFKLIIYIIKFIYSLFLIYSFSNCSKYKFLHSH